MIIKDKEATGNIMQEKQLRFWLFQLCGWLPFAFLLLPFFGDDDFLSVNTLLFALSVTTLALLACSLLRFFYQYISTKVVNVINGLLLILLASFLSALLVGALHYSLWYMIAIIDINLAAVYQNQPLISLVGLLFFVYLFWSGLYLSISKQEIVNNLTIKQQQLELLVKENKIKNLLEQLNPHFMFNTINNIRSLILQDPDKARDMLLSFADMMRYQINSNDEALVPLKEELDFVIDFIELHRLQLGKRLNFIQDIDSSLLGNVIPRMAIQLLVENAIKHSFNQSAKPVVLQITIGIEPTENCLNAWFISVKNSGVLTDKKSDSGIGLQNLNDRLKLSFENQYTLTLAQENEMVECKILFNY